MLHDVTKAAVTVLVVAAAARLAWELLRPVVLPLVICTLLGALVLHVVSGRRGPW